MLTEILLKMQTTRKDSDREKEIEKGKLDRWRQNANKREREA